MRKFKVLKCKQTRLKSERRTSRDSNGNLTSYMVYSEEKAGEGWSPGAYGHEGIKEGDILDIDGVLADKAANNPDFEEVFEEPVKAEKPVVKKKAKKKAKKKVVL